MNGRAAQATRPAIANAAPRLFPVLVMWPPRGSLDVFPILFRNVLRRYLPARCPWHAGREGIAEEVALDPQRRRIRIGQGARDAVVRFGKTGTCLPVDPLRQVVAR